MLKFEFDEERENILMGNLTTPLERSLPTVELGWGGEWNYLNLEHPRENRQCRTQYNNYKSYMLKKLRAVNQKLTNEMYLDLTNKDGNKKLYGWSLIPNVSKFKITTAVNSKLGESLGIGKKEVTEALYIPYRNRRLKKYCQYQLNRLLLCKKDKYKYFAIVKALIKRSKCFRIAALNHVIPHWYNKYPEGQIKKIMKKVQLLIEKEKDDLEYYRVYIEKKGSDKGRPLGVPKIEWRILLHMYSNFLQLYLQDRFLNSQHGYLWNRGTLSAGRELSKLVNYRYIYECDLKQFFPSVHVNEISRLLEEYNVPKSIIYYLENLNLNQPKLPSPSEQKLDESKYIQTQQDYEDIRNGYFRFESKMYDPVREFIKDNGIDILFEVTGSNNIFEIVQEQGALFDMYSPSKVKGMFEGVPQGSPISPLLAILTLKDFLSQTKSISYADDPIFVSNSPFLIRDDPEKGIIINKEKSGGVKEDGKGNKPLRYLGLELTEDRIRNGKKDFSLTGDFAQKIVLVIEKKSLKSGAEFMSYEGFGTIMARLYNGTGDTALDEPQNFHLEYEKNSIIDKIYNYKMDVFNASSLAGYHYVNRIRHIRSYTNFVKRRSKLVRRTKVN